MNRIIFQKSCNNIKNRCGAQIVYQNFRQISTGAPREAGFGKFLVILSPFLVGGGAVAYAKYDNEFRKSIANNIPGSEPVLKILLQEVNPLDGASKKFSDMTTSVSEFFGISEKEKSKKVESPKLPKIQDAPRTVAPNLNSSINTTSPTKSQKSSSNASTLPPPPPINPPTATVQPKAKPFEVPKNIAELEIAIEQAAVTAVREYDKAANILKAYNEDIKKIVDDSVDRIDPVAWVSLKNKTNARDTTVASAESAASEARTHFDKLQKVLDQDLIPVTIEVKEQLRKNIGHFMENVEQAKKEVFKAKEVSNVSEKYWKKVETARNYFVDEIESLFPGINLAEKKLDLSKEELDVFILHAYSHVASYQKELQKLQTDGETKLRRAIESLRGNDQSEALKAQVDYEIEKARREFNLENQKKIFKIRGEVEQRLREQMKRQSEAHADHLKDALQLKETEMKRIFARELDEKLAKEQAEYKTQLAAMVGKLKGMDASLKARADSEKSAHQAQALWAACQTLWSSVKNGQPGKTWREQLRPLSSEIVAVGKAAEGDELVAVVLTGLPAEAKERGVYPEEALRERFLKVQQVARKLALVPPEGGSLIIYFLSFLQAALITTPSNVISKEELEDQEFDFSKLDTYDILNRAKYWVDRGNLTKAVRYMNLLQGAPRKVASDWVNEARVLLETQQAANTLMAHAASNTRY